MKNDVLDDSITIKTQVAEFALIMRALSFCHNYYDMCSRDLEVDLTDEERKHFSKLSYFYDGLLSQFKHAYKGRVTWKKILEGTEFRK